MEIITDNNGTTLVNAEMGTLVDYTAEVEQDETSAV